MRYFRITIGGGKSTKIQIPFDDLAKTLIPLIEEVCKAGKNFLITDLDSEEDIIFLNAPSLQVRRYSTCFEQLVGERPALPELGIERSNSEFDKIATLFNLAEASNPKPGLLDDWDTYGDWMKHIAIGE